MATRIEGGFATIKIGASAVGEFRRVKLTAAGYVACAATDFGDAITERDSDAGEDAAPARLVNAPGEQFGVAKAAIAVGDTLMAAADGEVDKAAGETAVIVGKATRAAGAGEVVVYIGKSVG